MQRYVVDENVLVLANMQNLDADPTCIIRCIEILQELVEGGNVAIDAHELIFDAYRKHCNFSGQPNAGDEFFKFIYLNQYTENRCLRIQLTQNEQREFDEFPDSDELREFDRDDRKFAAVALCCHPIARVINATDSDWWDFREAFLTFGLVVDFTCPERFEGR